MNYFPLVPKKPELPEVAQEPAAPTPLSPFGPFLNFHFSYTEVSSRDGSTHVSSRQAQLEAGKLTTRSFEGELPVDAFGQIASQAQRQFLDQAQLMMRSLTWFLPPSMRLPFDRD